MQYYAFWQKFSRFMDSVATTAVLALPGDEGGLDEATGGACECAKKFTNILHRV